MALRQRPRHRCSRAQRRARHTQRLENTLVHSICVRLAADHLDEVAGHPIAWVRIGENLPRRREQPLVGPRANPLAQGIIIMRAIHRRHIQYSCRVAQ